MNCDSIQFTATSTPVRDILTWLSPGPTCQGLCGPQSSLAMPGKDYLDKIN